MWTDMDDRRMIDDSKEAGIDTLLNASDFDNVY